MAIHDPRDPYSSDIRVCSDYINNHDSIRGHLQALLRHIEWFHCHLPGFHGKPRDMEIITVMIFHCVIYQKYLSLIHFSFSFIFVTNKERR